MLDWTNIVTTLGTVLITAVIRLIEKRTLRKRGKLFDDLPE